MHPHVNIKGSEIMSTFGSKQHWWTVFTYNDHRNYVALKYREIEFWQANSKFGSFERLLSNMDSIHMQLHGTAK